ncbi:MAG: XylR family transcriptional regulator [Thermoguttaceae bacterium]
MKSLGKQPKVAIILGTAEEVDRGIIFGVLKYAKLHGPWWIRIFPTDYVSLKSANLIEWQGTGIIAQVLSEQVSSMVIETGWPLITIDPMDKFLEPTHQLSKYSEIRGNSKKVGEMAATFFMEKRFDNFAYIGDVNYCNWSKIREAAFIRTLNASGFACGSYNFPQEKMSSWARINHLGKWLQAQEKPVAVFAANDSTATLVIDACQNYNINIPKDISVLGVDNSQIRCNTTEPSLSSIARNHEGAGFAAAEHLDKLMRGQKLHRTTFFIEPTKIVPRQSTLVQNISDPLVLEALSFIRINSGLGINVQNVIKHLGVARRLVEQRFRVLLGCTIYQEIEKVRMEKIKTLLIETDMTFYEIAHSCYFSSEMYLANMFRKKNGMTMTEFRKKHQIKNLSRPIE